MITLESGSSLLKRQAALGPKATAPIITTSCGIIELLCYYVVAVHGFKGSEVQGYVLVPGLHF